MDAIVGAAIGCTVLGATNVVIATLAFKALQKQKKQRDNAMKLIEQLQQLQDIAEDMKSRELQFLFDATETKRLTAIYNFKKERLENELMREKQAKLRLEENYMHLKNQVEADKRKIERQTEQIDSASNEIGRACERVTSKEQQLARVTREIEGLKTALRREREAKGRLEEEREAYRREVERYTSILYEMSRDPRGIAERDRTKEDTGVSRHFHYIKENVTTEWKDLAYQLGFTRPDIDNIDERNRDYKSRCLDMLGEWQKRRGKAATLTALMEALMELGLTSVVDGLRSKYPGSMLSTQ